MKNLYLSKFNTMPEIQIYSLAENFAEAERLSRIKIVEYLNNSNSRYSNYKPIEKVNDMLFSNIMLIAYNDTVICEDK